MRPRLHLQKRDVPQILLRTKLLLGEEFKKKKPKSKTVKKLMDETEEARREWIASDAPSVQEVMAVFPSLRFQRWVSTYTYTIILEGYCASKFVLETYVSVA